MGSFIQASEKLKFIKPEEYIFVETGTYHGQSAIDAINFGFKKVYTIELQQHIYEIAKKNLEKYSNKINIYLGDSKNILAKILNIISDEKIVFWLDAHIDGGNYVQGITPNIAPCPLYHELNTIKNICKNKNNIIIIDDMRIIDSIGWGKDISSQKLKNYILEIKSDYIFDYVDTPDSKNDILIAR